MAANSLDRLTISFNVDSNYKALQLGFLEGANPGAYKRLLSIRHAERCAHDGQANASRGSSRQDHESPGRLRKSVTARRARFNTPAAVVGPRAGRSRDGGSGGAWYRWFVTSGISGVRQTKNGAKAVKAVPANPFVTRVSRTRRIRRPRWKRWRRR
jgi:hypothetical protein